MATVYAASASYADVNQAVNTDAGSGDTVIVPSGVETWATELAIGQPIILQGNGIGGTVITADGVRLMNISLTGNEAVDISGFSLNADSHTELFRVYNSSTDTALTDFRLHHCRFEQCAGIAIKVEKLVFGCVDHNQFYDNNYDFKILGHNAYSWDLFPRVAHLGSVNYLYIEDNTSSDNHIIIISSGEGARWVYRYNTLDGSSKGSDKYFDAHGDTLNRGVVAFELYENTIDPLGGAFQSLDYRGGTGIVFNNHFCHNTSSGWYGRILVKEENDGCTYVPGCDGSSGGDEVQDGYVWNNRVGVTGTESPVDVIESDPYEHIAEQTSWWDDDDNDPEYFTEGVFGSIPGASSDGDCYWATDTRTLYRSVGANNWVQQYTPYTYPHPLTVGGVEPPRNVVMVLG